MIKLVSRTFFILTWVAWLFPAPAALAQEPIPVLAFYYAWFDQNTWNSGQSVDLPAQPYNSSDPATIDRHVNEARAAGIDALVQSWYGPQVEGNPTETNFRTLLDISHAKGGKAAVDFEVTSPFLGDKAAVTSALATLLATHAQHPGYLRYQGKPVIFFWRQQRFSIEEWHAIRNQVDPGYSSYWIAEGVDIGYQAAFDGHHLYSIAWAASPAAQQAKWGNQVRAYEAANQVDRLWVATAMPGYDDTRLPRNDAFAVSRRDGAYYRETWQGAIASQPDMIIITSFNEWPEGTHLEPSAGYGNFYLELTRDLVTQLRGAPPAAPLPVVLAAQETPPEEPEAQEDPPEGAYIQVEGITNVRNVPSTDADILGRLGAGSRVSVIGRLEANDWWQIEFEVSAQGTGWVSADVVEFVGDVSTVPVVEAPEAPPAETPEAEDETPAGETVEETPETEAAGETPEPSATETPAAETEAEPATESTPAPQQSRVAPTVTIPEGGVNVRSGPGLDADILGRLAEGVSLPVIAQNEAGDWWLVEYEAGENGLAWVSDTVVEFSGDRAGVPVAGETMAEETPSPDDPPTPTATPTPVPIIGGTIEALDAINVRAEPSLDGALVGGLYLGETADVLAVSEDGQWWQIDLAGTPGWVATEFVRFQGDQESVPIFGLGTMTPTPAATNTPPATPTLGSIPTEKPTFAPTATSIYQATSAALLAQRGTPDPTLDESSALEESSSFSWGDIPWGILAALVIAGFLWYQFSQRQRQRRARRGKPSSN